MGDSCLKCCYWPCDQTSNTCGEGVYYKQVYGKVIKIMEPSQTVSKILEKVVIEALYSEV